MPDTRLLVFGRSGQVATALQERAQRDGVPVLALGRDRLDLSAGADIAGLTGLGAELREDIEAFRPTFAINAAAHTAVDKAESEETAASALNRDGAAATARIARDLGLRLAHISTDYVYDGSKPSPYVESDPTGPQSAYGRSKLAGELAVAETCPAALIFRTAWVYSPFGGNFVKTMLRLGAERDSLNVVADQFGCPTSALDIADALIAIAGRTDDATPGGVFHLAGTGEANWCEFAREIFRQSGERGGPSIPVNAIATVDYPTPAARPANSRLATEKLWAHFGLKLPSWRQSLGEVLDRLVGPSLPAASDIADRP